jgi:hypothetical protein
VHVVTEPDSEVRSLGERYLLVELIDADDQRERWRGHDDIASRPVLATVHLGVAPGDEWRNRFDLAARRLEALTHPGLASTLAHDSQDPQPWLVAAAVEGDLVEQIVADDGGLSTDDALAVVGQTAMAVKAAHGAGIAHGAIDGQHIVVRSDGSSALIDFQVPTTARTADDLTALATLSGVLVPPPELTDSTGADVAGFLRWVGSAGATDAGDIGRTALALAAAVRGVHSTSVVEESLAGDDDELETDAEPSDPNRPWYDEAERKRVRNGLIAIGSIVVIAGAALLFIISRGGGGANLTTVPDVRGLTLDQAQKQLNTAILRVDENITDANGHVTAESPAAGTVVKVGTLVTLHISEDGS